MAVTTHGYRGYRQGCSCDTCRAGMARYQRQLDWERHNGLPSRLTNAAGTIRRLRALVCLGYSVRVISVELGMNDRNLGKILVAPKDRVHRATAAKVARLYDAWSMTLPATPDSGRQQSVTRARRWAEDKGWHPPLAWDDATIDDPDATPATDTTDDINYDAVVVERFGGGEHTLTTTAPERAEICRRWHASGRPLAELARLTGWKTDRYFTIQETAA